MLILSFKHGTLLEATCQLADLARAAKPVFTRAGYMTREVHMMFDWVHRSIYWNKTTTGTRFIPPIIPRSAMH